MQHILGQHVIGCPTIVCDDAIGLLDRAKARHSIGCQKHRERNVSSRGNRALTCISARRRWFAGRWVKTAKAIACVIVSGTPGKEKSASSTNCPMGRRSLSVSSAAWPCRISAPDRSVPQ
jgi:hypothetical protein